MWPQGRGIRELIHVVSLLFSFARPDPLLFTPHDYHSVEAKLLASCQSHPEHAVPRKVTLAGNGTGTF